jgi:hypothetical protein
VSFPRKTEGGAFDIVRQGQKVQVWPEPDKYEKELVGWARAIGAACGSDDEVRVRVRQERETASFPALWRERGLANFESHVKPWLSMLDWVLPRTCITALPVTGEQAPMRYEILDLKVRQLVRDNLEFFRSFVDATKVDTDFSDHEVIRTVLQFARREIARLEAQAWWTTHGNAEAVCDGCNGKLKRDDGYAIRERTVRVGPATINMDEEILCGSCFDRLVVHGK